MKKKFGLFGLTLALAFFVGLAKLSRAQNPASPQEKEATEKEEATKPETTAVRAGTKISAELESTVDTRTAKPGDEVTARVTKDVRQDGRTVIHKGDRLAGRVTSVEAASKADAGSRMAVAFDRLVQGQATSQLNTVVTAILSTPAEERARQERMAEPGPVMVPAPGPAPSGPAPRGGAASGGGLVGGVTSTVDSTVRTTAPVVGGVTGTVDATSRTAVGNTTGAALATPMRAIRVESHGQAEHQSGVSSLLSTRQGHLRLESGTNVQMRVVAESEGRSQRQTQTQNK